MRRRGSTQGGREDRPRGRPRSPRLARWLVLGAAASVAIALWWAAHPHTVQTRRSEAADSLAGLDPRQAYVDALRLTQNGRAPESLPYFRRALEGIPGEHVETHLDYSDALHAAARTRRKRGAFLEQSAVRSSVERVEMMKESFRQLDLAETMISAPEDRAFINAARAYRYWEWGFPLEAQDYLRRATALAPNLPAADSLLQECIKSLRDPARAGRSPQEP